MKKNIEDYNEKYYRELIDLIDAYTIRRDLKQYKKTKTQNPESLLLQFIQKFYGGEYEKLTREKLTKKQLLLETYAFTNGYRDFYNLIVNHATVNHEKPFMVYSEYKPLHRHINFDVLLKQLYGNAEDIETLKGYNLNVKPLDYIKKGLCKYTLALKGYRYLHEILGYGISYKKFYEMNPIQKNQYLIGFINETQKHLSTSKLYRIIYELLLIQKTDKMALRKLVTIINREPQRLKIIRRFTKTKNETKYNTQKDMAIMISRLYQKFKNDEGDLNIETETKHESDNNHETVTTPIPTQEKNLLKWYIENSNRNLITQ